MKTGFIQKLRIAAILLVLATALVPKTSSAMPTCLNIFNACLDLGNAELVGANYECEANTAAGTVDRLICQQTALETYWDWEDECDATYNFCVGDCGNGQPGGNP